MFARWPSVSFTAALLIARGSSTAESFRVSDISPVSTITLHLSSYSLHHHSFFSLSLLSFRFRFHTRPDGCRMLHIISVFIITLLSLSMLALLPVDSRLIRLLRAPGLFDFDSFSFPCFGGRVTRFSSTFIAMCCSTTACSVCGRLPHCSGCISILSSISILFLRYLLHTSIA